MQRNPARAGAAPVERRRTRGPGPRVQRASALCGERVVGKDGEALGTISEIMLDVTRGRIAYAVLAIGGFMGVGEQMFAVPWKALRPDAGRKCFVADIDQKTLDDAPGFDKDHWPSEPDVLWHQQLHGHYGAAPYWEA